MELTSTTLSFGYAYCVSCLKGGCQRRLGHKIRTVPIEIKGTVLLVFFYMFFYIFFLTCVVSYDLRIPSHEMNSHTTPVVKPYERASRQGRGFQNDRFPGLTGRIPEQRGSREIDKFGRVVDGRPAQGNKTASYSTLNCICTLLFSSGMNRWPKRYFLSKMK